MIFHAFLAINFFDVNPEPMSLLNKSLKQGIASPKKPITKAHLPNGEVWPSSADVSFRHVVFLLIISTDFPVIISIDSKLIPPAATRS
jgi:hypothetical protein